LGIIYHLFHYQSMDTAESAAENMFTRSGYWLWLHLARQHQRMLRVLGWDGWV
jgi:hypothetical protein